GLRTRSRAYGILCPVARRGTVSFGSGKPDHGSARPAGPGNPRMEAVMAEAFIAGAVRTAIGRRIGSLAGVHPVDLAAHALRGLVDRTGVDPAAVDDVIMGCVSQIGPQTFD